MRGKISARTLAIGFVALCCTAPAVASADVHLSFGTRWQPLRYTTAAYPFADGTAPAATRLSGFQSTSLDPYVAVFFAQKYGVLLGLDVGYGKVGTEKTAGTTSMFTNDSYFQFGFSLGFKWYITQPRREKVAPLLYADFYKYFASITTDKMNVTGDQAGFNASLLSPIGGTIAFGAEYFVTPNFSVGSEIFGLKIAGVSGELNNGMSRQTASYTYVTFYTAITLNYRFQVQASVQAGDEEADAEAEKPKKKKKVVTENNDEEGAATPTPPPPPPSPEAVD
jgi:hypothetical protein